MHGLVSGAGERQNFEQQCPRHARSGSVSKRVAAAGCPGYVYSCLSVVPNWQLFVLVDRMFECVFVRGRVFRQPFACWEGARCAVLGKQGAARSERESDCDEWSLLR